MADRFVSEELWDAVRPSLPQEGSKPKGGRPKVSDRDCLEGIVFVLRTGAAWNAIPRSLGVGSGVTCWRRFRDWSEAGVWPSVWHRVLQDLGKRGAIDYSVAVVDSASQRAVFGGPTPDRIRQTAPKTARNAML